MHDDRSGWVWVKPPPFEYVAPDTIDAALEELSNGDGEARPLAGGQSLIPLLNFRLSNPAILIDLHLIGTLRGVTVDDAFTTVNAMTPVARLLDTDVATAAPLLSAAARLVAHPQIRARSTVGGSIAHADPAAELPAVAVLSGAAIRIAGPDGQREIGAERFFKGVYETTCDWNELVVAVRFPRLSAGTGWGFREFARRPGDFALAGVGVILSLSEDVISSVRIAAFGLGSVPVRIEPAESVMRGQPPTDEVIAYAGEALVHELSPSDTLHGTGAYRRHLSGVLFRRAVSDAVHAARASTGAQ